MSYQYVIVKNWEYIYSRTRLEQSIVTTYAFMTLQAYQISLRYGNRDAVIHHMVRKLDELHNQKMARSGGDIYVRPHDVEDVSMDVLHNAALVDFIMPHRGHRGNQRMAISLLYRPGQRINYRDKFVETLEGLMQSCSTPLTPVLNAAIPMHIVYSLNGLWV